MGEMEGKLQQSEKYIRAQRQVRQIKKFYRHLRIFIVVNIVLLIVKFKALDYFETEDIQDQGFLDWFQWNVMGTPVLWGLGLLVHGLYVFVFHAKPFREIKPRFLKRWEERELQRLLREEEKKESSGN